MSHDSLAWAPRPLHPLVVDVTEPRSTSWSVAEYNLPDGEAGGYATQGTNLAPGYGGRVRAERTVTQQSAEAIPAP